jgi:hypothetical protein
MFKAFFLIMEELLKLGRKFMNLKRDQIMFRTMTDNPFLKKLVIDLNQQNQLQHGINGLGEKLPDYSERSVNEFGKRPGPFTLEDTGDFYKSFEVILDVDGFIIEADGIKFDFEPVDLVALYDPLGLTKESIDIFGSVLLPLIGKTILNEITE